MPRPTGRVAASLTAASALLAILAYATQIPGGHWQGDEFAALQGYRAFGPTYFAYRLTGAHQLSQSLRPVAEALTTAYVAAVAHLGRPLVPEMLGLTWALGIALAVAVPLGRRSLADTAHALALFALLLLLRPTGEAFFWPIGAAAYVPMLGALAGVSASLRRPVGGPADLWRIAALLLVAATNNEIGASVALAFCALALPLCVARRRALAPFVLTGGVSAAVCALTWHGRMQDSAELWRPSSPYAHATGASLAGALPILGRIALFLRDPPGGIAPGAIAGSALLLAAALAFARAPASQTNTARPDRSLVVAWVAALALAAWASVASALRSFGEYCCQRHTSVQQALLVLAVAAIMSLVPLGVARVRAFILPLGLLVLLFARRDDLARSNATLPAIATTRAQNWHALIGPVRQIRFQVSAGTPVVNGNSLDTGRFAITDPKTPWDARAMMAAFGKDNVTVAPP